MIAIVNYGLGNVRAFANIYKKLDLPYRIASCASELDDASKLVLPGVGAFDEAMQMLIHSGMREALNEKVLEQGIPVLGVCVGMQMLARGSEEGELDGLGWIDGDVRRLDVDGLQFRTRLPHMGWNRIESRCDAPLLHGLADGSRFYFLHSYYFRCARPEDSIAQTDYASRFTSAVNAENIYGVQFHPEKSHFNGIQLLRNFGTL